MKFTPGPWRSKELQVYNEKTGQTVAQIGIWGCKTEGEAEANALLISKAPTMYEMLTKVEDIISGMEAEADNKGIDLKEARQWWIKVNELLKEIEL